MTQEQKHIPYIPADSRDPEFTIKALLLGLLMAVVLGAANAYLGLKAGMTIAATIPAAVISIAAFRLPFFRGGVLEQNIARTTASVGEALVAGAIFTIPAFVMVDVGGERLWTSFNYWETTMLLLIGGVLGILFVIFLRRTMVVEADLPFPEAAACAEIVKAGQTGESGAKYVFGAMGVGVIIEILKNSTGFAIFREYVETFFAFPRSVVRHFDTTRASMGEIAHGGGIPFATPLASPALIGVGYIIGPRLAAINFTGGVIAWLVFIPLSLFLSPELRTQLSVGGLHPEWGDVTYSIWYNQVRPIAVGAMLVGSIYTLWGLRKSLLRAFKGALLSRRQGADTQDESRLEKDLDMKWIVISIAALVIPVTFVYYYFSGNILAAIIGSIIMVITGFLFSAVGAWLVGLVGGSNQPISGLTLSALIVTALVMVASGVSGLAGVAAVLGVAAVVCCATAVSGDMIQDLKVGYALGGTPWKMEVAEIISTVLVSFVLVFPIIILHEGNIAAGGIGIGDTKLPAPQAGLMAQLAVGIVSGEMPWGLIFIGMSFAVALIMIKAPAPMLIAVGMYLPFETTFAIFVGGAFKWTTDLLLEKKGAKAKEMDRVSNKGVLVASGFIAGEALTGVFLAAAVLMGAESLLQTFFGIEEFPWLHDVGAVLSLLIFGAVAYGLIVVPRRGK